MDDAQEVPLLPASGVLAFPAGDAAPIERTHRYRNMSPFPFAVFLAVASFVFSASGWVVNKGLRECSFFLDVSVLMAHAG